MSNDKLAQALRDLDEAYCRAGSPLTKAERAEDRKRLIAARAALAAHEAEKQAKPPKHKFWGAGEADCPADLKATNGELHSRRCKVCGETNPRDQYCWNAAPLSEQDKEDAERYTIDEITEAVLYAEIPDGQFKSMLISLNAIRAARAKKEQQC